MGSYKMKYSFDGGHEFQKSESIIKEFTLF